MRKGIITISFDDAYLDTYIHAFPYLDKNGIESTFAVPVNLIGKKCENRPVVNWKQLKEMRKKGHDIASHTLSHKKFNTLLSTSKANARSEIINSKRILQKHLDAPIPSFVYPYISRLPDKYVHRIVKQNYTSSRISKNYPVFNKLPIKNRYAVKGFCVMKTHSIGFIKKQVDYVKSNNVWLNLVFHLVGKKNTKSIHAKRLYRFFSHVTDFCKIVAYIKKNEISILTQKQIIEKYAK